jgi:hypothetical protein
MESLDLRTSSVPPMLACKTDGDRSDKSHWPTSLLKLSNGKLKSSSLSLDLSQERRFQNRELFPPPYIQSG